MQSWRPAIIAVAVLLACPAGQAPGQVAPRQRGPRGAAPSGPVLQLGALLPLTGPGAWFGAEIRQGLQLAVAELEPPTEQGATAGGGGASDAPASTEGEGTPSADLRAAPKLGPSKLPKVEPETDPKTAPKASSESAPGASAQTGETGAEEPASPDSKKRRTREPVEPIEPADRPRTLRLALQALDVQPLDLRDVEVDVTRLLGSGVAAIVTASPSPTLTVHPQAAARDVLVFHAGLVTDRFPAASRTLFQLRPSEAARADVLAAHAWQRGIRRLALLTGGDPFGRAVRGAVAARWRQQGGHLVHDESVSMDASDLRARLRPVVRAAPEAVLLGFHGVTLGEGARALRDAGYAGPLLAMDDDRAVLLAGGRAVDGTLILTDAFVPVPGTRGARFAKAYQARHGQPPSRFAASAYEMATLLVEVGSRVLREGRSLTGSRLREILFAERRFPSLYAGDIVVRDDGTLARPLALFRVDADRLAFETYVGPDGRALATPPGGNP